MTEASHKRANGFPSPSFYHESCASQSHVCCWVFSGLSWHSSSVQGFPSQFMSQHPFCQGNLYRSLISRCYVRVCWRYKRNSRYYRPFSQNIFQSISWTCLVYIHDQSKGSPVFQEQLRLESLETHLAELILLQDVKHCSLKCQQSLGKAMLSLFLPRGSFLLPLPPIPPPHQIPYPGYRVNENIKIAHSSESFGTSVLTSGKEQETPRRRPSFTRASSVGSSEHWNALYA